MTKPDSMSLDLNTYIAVRLINEGYIWVIIGEHHSSFGILPDS